MKCPDCGRSFSPPAEWEDDDIWQSADIAYNRATFGCACGSDDGMVKEEEEKIEPVIVIPVAQWKRLVANWRVISAVTDGVDEGTLESAAAIDAIIASVEVSP